jgi:hypothetical protein
VEVQITEPCYDRAGLFVRHLSSTSFQFGIEVLLSNIPLRFRQEKKPACFQRSSGSGEKGSRGKNWALEYTRTNYEPFRECKG